MFDLLICSVGVFPKCCAPFTSPQHCLLKRRQWRSADIRSLKMDDFKYAHEQAAAKTNNLAGDGTTTSVVLEQGLIAEGVKVVAAGANLVLIIRGIEKTTRALGH
ncbi:hypothetical protein J1N35_040555 [Gossypium stocksii]|uniref:Uncharacterized protein n=1 Tax=Gossypium stocksii TaxID=47602 RepID=A0A9D3UE67_9ROSI|nr:hypothetical protein J1N35_040555 [Gossypium stocksii]